MKPVESSDSVFIAGKWRPAASGRTYEVTNPATGSVIARVADGDASDATAAVDAARVAFDDWAGTTAYERSRVLRVAHQLMVERSGELAELMTTEQGKPLKAARAEVAYAADFLDWFSEEAKRAYGRTIASSRPNQRFVTMRQPVGVVAAITPWNYPISMLSRKLGPAVAAGCTVVLKPAEQTPLCAVAVLAILDEAGLPPGVVNMVTCADPRPVGEVFVSDPAVAKITFTGSTAVGKMLLERAAPQVKRVSLELGGHAPVVVFDDADVERVAKGLALLKMLNAGQACISPNRIFVQRSVHDAFVEAFARNVGRMTVGDGFDPTVDVGPLIDGRALERVSRQVIDATAKGARLHVGGARHEDAGSGGHFFQPTVLSGVTEHMDVFYSESFGPIAAIMEFDSEDEAVRRANDTRYGLASYVFTRDLSRAVRVAERLRFAIVGVNDLNPTSAAAPFGGLNESGLGREGAQEGLDEYLETKLVGVTV